jgi:methylase of polypeptide subunit release factors
MMPGSDLRFFADYEDISLRLFAGVQPPGVETVYLVESIGDRIPKKVLVIGCGAGLEAVYTAKRGANVIAVDLNEGAVANCLENARLNNVEDRIEGVIGDITELDSPISRDTFDLILCNPPQLPTPGNQLRKRWMHLANDGGRDGLEMIRWICSRGVSYLEHQGRLLFTYFYFFASGWILELCNEEFHFSIRLAGHKRSGPLSTERFERLGIDLEEYGVNIVEATRA